jgi:hypothetical protein
MSIAEAAAALRSSPAGYLESLRCGHRSVEDHVKWLEDHQSDPLTQRIAEKLPRRLTEIEQQMAVRAEDERAAEFGRQVIAALKAYMAAGGSL